MKEKKWRPKKWLIPFVIIYLTSCFYYYFNLKEIYIYSVEFNFVFFILPKTLWFVLTLYVLYKLLIANKEEKFFSKIFISIASFIFSGILYLLTVTVFLEILILVLNSIYINNNEILQKKCEVVYLSKDEHRTRYTYHAKFIIENRIEEIPITFDEFALYSKNAKYINFNLSKGILGSYKVHSYEIAK